MVLWQHVVLCKGTSLRMHLTVGVRSLLRCEPVSRNVTHYAHLQSDAFPSTYPYTARHAATAPY